MLSLKELNIFHTKGGKKTKNETCVKTESLTCVRLRGLHKDCLIFLPDELQFV